MHMPKSRFLYLLMLRAFVLVYGERWRTRPHRETLSLIGAAEQRARDAFRFAMGRAYSAYQDEDLLGKWQATWKQALSDYDDLRPYPEDKDRGIPPHPGETWVELAEQEGAIAEILDDPTRRRWANAVLELAMRTPPPFDDEFLAVGAAWQLLYAPPYCLERSYIPLQAEQDACVLLAWKGTLRRALAVSRERPTPQLVLPLPRAALRRPIPVPVVKASRRPQLARAR
jgi:hypothetical protein